MRHLLSIWILLATVASAFAGDIITGTLTVTNAANINSTNAYTIVVNADTRTWTNSVVDASDEILATPNNATAVQRLLIHFATYPVSSLTLLSDGSTYVAWRTAESGSLTITLNTNTWGSVSYATNTVGSAVAVRVPYTVESTATKNAVSDGLMNWINLAPTNYLGSRKVNWAQSAQTADSAVTNFVANLTGNPYRTITAAANVNFVQSTNRPTAATNALQVVYFITASGADRTLTLNSSWKPTPSAITIASGAVGILTVTGRGTAETDVHWTYTLGGSVSDTDDQTAAEVVSTPAGTLAANDVQEALDELDTEKVATSRQLTVAGTANEITSSAGAQTLAADRTWTLSLPTAIDLGGKTSLEIPNAAAPTVSAFGQIASDNNLWDTGRGAVLHYDGTAATALVGVLVSDAPSNGQVPKWNTGGTITWENDSGAAGGDSITVDGVAVSDPNFDDGGDINFTDTSNTITATVKADSVALTTDTTGNYAAGDAEAGGATKITNGNTDATLSNAGEMHLNTTDEQLSFHSAADGEISGEVALPLIQHRAWSFDPDAVCDGSVDRLFLFTIGDQAPEGIKIVEWKVSFEADPTTEADLDLKYADAFIGVANATVIDVLDTTNGTSSEDTNANINGGSAIANGKVLYLEFGTAYTETGHQVIFEMWFYAEED